MFALALLLAIGAASDTLVIADVNVLPMNRSVVLDHQTVVIADGRIVALGPANSVATPSGARVIDGRGKYLMPGLADMHVHLTSADELPMYVGKGVLTVRDLNGSPETLEWRADVARGAIVGPRIFASGPMIAGPGTPWRNKVTPTTAAETESFIRAQKAAGYDQIKIYDGITKVVFDAAIATANRLGLPASGHIPATVGLDGALAAGLSLEHIDKTVFAVTQHELDTARIPSIVARIKRAGVWVTPTLESMVQLSYLSAGRFDSLMSRPEALAAPAALHDYWTAISIRFRGNRQLPPSYCSAACEYQMKLAGALAQAGVPMLAGTDLPNAVLVPGYSLIRELQVLVDAGLTPYQALVSATSAPARFFGQEKEWGTVAVGQRANLYMIERNPLDDVAVLDRPYGVVLDGRWIDEKELARLRRGP